MSRTISCVIGTLFLLSAIFYFGFVWTVNRVYVPEGKSLTLRYKGALVFGFDEMAPAGHFAKEGQVGVRQKMRGPGRHFYCPIWYERTVIDDVVIRPGEIGIVTCKLGDDLPTGEFLVDGDIGVTKSKGILRKVLHPGRYRIHPYAYGVKIVMTQTTKGRNGQVKYSGWVQIPTGYVGVVTNLADNPMLKQFSGIQVNVLPPGNYPINGKEQKVDIVEIGYRVATVEVKKQLDSKGRLLVDKSGEPMVSNSEDGINFPSNDGFPIHLDFTAIWGLMPDQASRAISTFGDIKAVENKIVLPQIESICRNNGSQYSAVQLLVGGERQKFQTDTLNDFKNVLAEKHITLLNGLVRHIYIPRQVREPIQTGYVADELKLTREQEQLTAREESNLREAEKKVDLEAERVRSETTKLVAEKMADAEKFVGETQAETKKLVAEIDRQTAELESQALLVLGKAEANGEKMLAEARSQKFKLAVEAFGTSEAYTNYVFADGLPEDIDLKFLYAGEGTLWTDSKNIGIRATIPIKKDK